MALNTELMACLNEHMGRPVFIEGKCSLSEETLPFYAGVSVISATTLTTIPMITRRFVGDGRNFVTLDGTEDCMEEINERYKLVLNEETVVDYLAFYLSAVKTQNGYFRLIKTAEDLEMDVEENDELLDVMKKLITLPTVTKEGNAFFVKGFILLENTMYHAEMTVLADGNVELTDARVAYEDLPVEVVLPLR